MKSKSFSVSKSVGGIIAVALILLVGLKGCVIQTINFKDDLVGQTIDQNGEIEKVYFLKGGTRCIIKKGLGDSYEYGILRLKGTGATHYFGPLYSVGQSLLGLRIYRGATAIWKSEIELEKKDGNLKESVFPEIGEKMNTLIIIRDSSFEMRGHTYQLIEKSADDIRLIDLVKSLKFKSGSKFERP